jgi:hypothetical protein
MSPESLIILESGARVSSALVLGVFLVVAVRTVLQNLDRRRSAAQPRMKWTDYAARCRILVGR